MKKRLPALLLAALLLCGALSGCGAIDALEDRLDNPSTSVPYPENVSHSDALTQELYFYSSWRADTHYEDMSCYVDLDYFRSLGDELLSIASADPDQGDFDDAVFYFVDEYYYIRTALELADLKYYRDPSDAEALAALDDAYAANSEADGIFWDVMHQTALTDSYDLLAEYCGEAQAEIFAAYEPNAQADSTLYDRENALVNEYYSLYASPDADVEAMMEVFVELVNVRREIAAAEGYDNYADYAYYNTYSRDYLPEDVQTVWSAVKEYFVPLILENSETLGLNYGDILDSGLECSAEDTLAALGTIAHGLSPEAAEAYDYMVEYGLCDNEELPTKTGTSFTTTLYWYNEPFIFLAPTGDCYDYTSLIHEFGHFLNSYAIPSDMVFGSPDFEVCEMQSIGMQLMATHWYEELFGADTARMLELETFYDIITNVIDGAMYDEFLQRTYAEENLTAERACEIYAELYEEYGYTPYEGSRYDWVYVPHNFDSPFYYISYCLATIPVLELYSELQSSPESAADTYMRLVATDPEIYYCSEVVADLSLPDPLSPSSYSSAADTIAEAISSLA